jgi:hypothetical protein
LTRVYHISIYTLIKKVVVEPKSKRLVTYYETILLQERLDALRARKGWKKCHRSILDDDPLTQSGVWYDLRQKYLIPNNIPINSGTTIERLGITFDTLNAFQVNDIEIDQEKVEETYL